MGFVMFTSILFRGTHWIVCFLQAGIKSVWTFEPFSSASRSPVTSHISFGALIHLMHPSSDACVVQAVSPPVLAAGSKRQASPAPRRELMQANPLLTLTRQDSKAAAAPAGADVTDVTVSVSQLPVPRYTGT